MNKVTIERKQVTREEVVALFGEKSVSKYEKDLLLGVDRPLVKKQSKVSKIIRNIIGFSILGTMVYGMITHTLITVGICTVVSGVIKLIEKVKK